MDRNYDVITFIFADPCWPFFIKTIFRLKKVKRIRMHFISVFLDMAKFADFKWKNAKISRTQGVCHVIHMFLDLLWVRYNCAKFHHSRMCVTEFREEQLSTSACKNWEKIIYIFNARRLTVLFLKMWNLYHFKMWLSFT